jgi:hypothetical protein
MKYVPSEPKQIKTNRYLFHVSHPMSRRSIERKGLLMSKFLTPLIPSGVYAHNLITEPDWTWYPFVLFGDFEDGPIENNPLKYYDFWRIDTRFISNKWFIDQAARHDFRADVGHDPKDMYVYTDEPVSVSALQLFRMQNDQYWEFQGAPGTYHYRSLGEFRPYVE